MKWRHYLFLGPCVFAVCAALVVFTLNFEQSSIILNCKPYPATSSVLIFGRQSGQINSLDSKWAWQIKTDSPVTDGIICSGSGILVEENGKVHQVEIAAPHSHHSVHIPAMGPCKLMWQQDPHRVCGLLWDNTVFEYSLKYRRATLHKTTNNKGDVYLARKVDNYNAIAIDNGRTYVSIMSIPGIDLISKIDLPIQDQRMLMDFRITGNRLYALFSDGNLMIYTLNKFVPTHIDTLSVFRSGNELRLKMSFSPDDKRAIVYGKDVGGNYLKSHLIDFPKRTIDIAHLPSISDHKHIAFVSNSRIFIAYSDDQYSFCDIPN